MASIAGGELGRDVIRLARPQRGTSSGRRVAIDDDAINAGTAVRACAREVRDGGAAAVGVAALLSLGRASTVVEATMAVPFYAVATMPSLVWAAGACPPCTAGTSLTDPRWAVRRHRQFSRKIPCVTRREAALRGKNGAAGERKVN